MKFHKTIAHSILFFTLPSLAVLPQAQVPASSYQTYDAIDEGSIAHVQIQNSLQYSYDDILNLLDQLENGDLENRCTLAELEQINQFLALLAREGLLHDETKDELSLEKDIQELISPDNSDFGYWYSLDGSKEFFYVADSLHSTNNPLLCKSWLKKKCEKVKKFVKKHKKEILIGVAVVVAVTIIVVCAVSVASSAAAAAAAAASSADGDSNPHHHNSNDTEKGITAHNADSSQYLASATDSVLLKTAMDEQISSFKELIVEDNLLATKTLHESPAEVTLGEKTRYLGSFFAHEVLNGIAQIGSILPQAHQELLNATETLNQITHGLLPKFETRNSLLYHENINHPIEHYQRIVAAGHQKIDQIFSTDLSDHFTATDSNNANTLKNNVVIGILPPPGVLNSGITKHGQMGRIPATQASSINGWKLGDPINNRTILGSVPKWNTVRRRYWKNQAHLHPETYRPNQLERMKQGLAPQRVNTKTGQMESMELHHNPAQKDGGLFDFIEVWPEEHALLDKQRHIGR